MKIDFIAWKNILETSQEVVMGKCLLGLGIATVVLTMTVVGPNQAEAVKTAKKQVVQKTLSSVDSPQFVVQAAFVGDIVALPAVYIVDKSTEVGIGKIAVAMVSSRHSANYGALQKNGVGVRVTAAAQARGSIANRHRILIA